MEWNEAVEARFTELRLRELSGELTIQEQAELDEIISSLEEDEAKLLTPWFTTVQKNHEALKKSLSAIQADNDELAKLVNQQEKLAADARRWLIDFDRRNAQIQRSYMRLTGKTPASS